MNYIQAPFHPKITQSETEEVPETILHAANYFYQLTKTRGKLNILKIDFGSQERNMELKKNMRGDAHLDEDH